MANRLQGGATEIHHGWHRWPAPRHAPGARRSWPRALAVGLLAVGGLAPGAEGQGPVTPKALAAYDARVVRCDGGSNIVYPDRRDDSEAEDPREVHKQDKVEGINCAGFDNSAEFDLDVSLPRQNITVSIDVTNPQLIEFDGNPMALAAVGYIEQLRFDSTSLDPGGRFVTLYWDVSGTRSAQRPCNQPPVPLQDEPCLTTEFTNPGFLVDSKGQFVTQLNIPMSNTNPTRRARFVSRVQLVPGRNAYTFTPGFLIVARLRGHADFAHTINLYVEMPPDVQFAGSASGVAGDERADLFLAAGRAVPEPEGSLIIAPPSGTLLTSQAFDLALIVQTAGQAIASVTATLDGQDISAAVSGCTAAFTAPLTGGTPGTVLRCPGLTGSLLGAGTHTLAVSVALSGGLVLADSATWEILSNAE